MKGVVVCQKSRKVKKKKRHVLSVVRMNPHIWRAFVIRSDVLVVLLCQMLCFLKEDDHYSVKERIWIAIAILNELIIH